MPLKDLTEQSVKLAIQEFDTLKRDAFLAKYHFGKAQDYFLIFNGQSYDSKAIAGAAHGYLPGQSALGWDTFKGGARDVVKKLRELHFDVVSADTGELPIPGEVLTNDDIARRFRVGTMGGMRRSLKLNHLVLISDPFKGLYQDRWEGNVLHYTGMGKSGDQSLSVGQNPTLAKSNQSKIPIHLLEALTEKAYTYVGQVELIDAPYSETQLDDSNQERRVWMFPLKLKSGRVPELSESEAQEIAKYKARLAAKLTLADLKARAQRSKGKPPRRPTQTSAYVRDPFVAEFAKRMANGRCDLCDGAAPFRDKGDDWYLECHHVIWLAKGGDDTIGNTVALCPNCHRKMHILNIKKDQETLLLRAASRAKAVST